MEFSALRQRLSEIRRRSLMIGASSALVRGLLAMFTLVFAGVWLDLVWELSPELRLAVLVTAAVGGCGLLAILIWRTFRGSREADMARRLDQAGHLGGDILTGWELRAAGAESTATMPQPTRDMARMAVARAARLAQQVSGRDAVAARPLIRSLAGFTLFAILVAAIVLLVPGLGQTAWMRFTHPYDDVPPLARTEFKVEPGNTSVRYGDGLDIYARPSGAPVERLDLVLIPGGDAARAETLPMFAETDGRWRAALAKVTEPATYYVSAHHARSYQFKIDVVLVPEIENVRMRLVPPAYTNEAPHEGPIPKDGIAGLPGTKVELRATSNRPLSGGEIRFTPLEGSASTLPMDRPGAGELDTVGRFEIRASGKLELRVIDVAGQKSRDAFTTTVTRLVDTAPFVRILAPRDGSLATPSANLPVEIAAEDDYGLSRVQLFRSLNDSRPLPMDIRRATPPPRRLHEKLYLPLASYGLEAGDVIKLFARAEDNDPAGAKGSESTVVTVRIISQEEFERMVRVRQGLQGLLSKYNQSKRRLEKLASEMEGLRKRHPPPKDPKDGGLKKKKLAETDRKELKQLAKRLRDEAKAIRLAAQHALPYDIDSKLAELLAKEAKELEQMAGDLEGLQSASEATEQEMQDLLEKLAKQLQEERQQHEDEATVPLEFLAKLFALIADLERFDEIVARQKDLAERLAAVKDREAVDDPLTKARLRDLESEQHRLRDDLKSVLISIENHARELPDDPRLKDMRDDALEFVKEVRDSGAETAMTAAEEAMTEFNGKQGHAKAKEAADILDKFLDKSEKLEKNVGEGLKLQLKLSRMLGGTVGQLLGEMGLGRGKGQGAPGSEGSGGGYSSRRGPGVGLYGNLPTLGGEGAGEGSGDDRAADPNSGSGGSAAPPGDRQTLSEVPGTAAASGAAQAQIPPRYRQRVGQYFQRVAEEAGK